MPAKKDPRHTLYLLDAFALIYRAYFAFGARPMTNSRGLNVSAIVGFTNTLYDLLTKEKPTHIAIAFDSKGATLRSQEFDFYKAHREEIPEDIVTSIPYIHSIVEAFKIPILQLDGYEADDIIGTIAKKAEKDGYTTYMVTPDKDFGQLVSENIFIYKPAYQQKPVEILGVPEILQRWDIERVDQVIDLLGLMGDASDNIPGIKGVGEKTAISLLKQFGTLENVLYNAPNLAGKLKEKVEAGKEMAIISKKLATIVTDVPIPYEPDKYIMEEPDREQLSNIFSDLEFRTLGKRILGNSYEVNQGGSLPPASAAEPPNQAPQKQLSLFEQSIPANNLQAELLQGRQNDKGKNINNTPHQYQLANTPEAHRQLLHLLLQQKAVCFDTETTGIDPNNSQLVGLSFAFEPHTGWYVPVPENQTEAHRLLQLFKPFYENSAIVKIAQNLKYDALILKWYDIAVQGTLHDTMIAHYLIDPDLRHNLTILAETYLHYTPVPIEDLIGKKGKNQLSMRDVPIENVAAYASEDADITLQLHLKFSEVIEKSGLHNLYSNVEMPLVSVLTNMEFEGVSIDVAFLKKYSLEVGLEIEQIKKEVFAIAGMEFNLDSPKQLGTVLFERLKIPFDGRKTATGQYSTDEDTLQALAALNHKIAVLLLDYRELSKLRSTYIDALPQLINPKSGRLHTTFNQTVASTGRLSSTGPNLQNIPIRTDRGKEIRKAFIPRSNEYVLLSADYSQIELRLMAHMSGDAAMLQAFKDGHDIHRATAARVYNVPLEQVDAEMRRKAKMVNFGIIYGITAFGLAQRLGISRSEAAAIIEEYFRQYPGVKAYMDLSIEKARKQGYAETLLGRRRYLKDINSQNRTVRSFAERNAINTPLQGTAAELIKVAMINIHRRLKEQNLLSKMVLQVHDELVFDVYQPELDTVRNLVEYEMKHAMPSLLVPIEVESGSGLNWLEAH
ncbi:DNA polymerase I [Sphingobacteriales bacterium UPWRP_1]|nr:DNA polymerase I [Sphingobacteriales bacterium TSM_CSS]PSJ78667.1 DNA polymerase I [Sphingobacteriales bacterium UPWRP_1]